MSVLDFDIPFSILFVVAAGVELLVTIGIMTFVTWQVLIVAVLAMVAVKYVQVHTLFSTLSSSHISLSLIRENS